ncbi:Hsp20/alpha crystallin family protein [Paenibacillus sp. NPDC058071]|uniref:Hsp20/alpha crystallin family protein n=1 Tax=Paenibacillus sp. NPDC058071 TaxID=3346326 RepID=UPI0036DADAB6
MTSKWDELERWMEGQKLPKGFDVLREPDWVEQFVRKMMTKSLPEAAGMMQQQDDGPSVFETHHFVFVKFPLPSGVERDSLRLFVREDRIRIDGLPGDRKETVKLPKPVKPKICRALVKNGVLQIKLRKRPGGAVYYEAPIRW